MKTHDNYLTRWEVLYVTPSKRNSFMMKKKKKQRHHASLVKPGVATWLGHVGNIINPSEDKALFPACLKSSAFWINHCRDFCCDAPVFLKAKVNIRPSGSSEKSTGSSRSINSKSNSACFRWSFIFSTSPKSPHFSWHRFKHTYFEPHNKALSCLYMQYRSETSGISGLSSWVLVMSQRVWYNHTYDSNVWSTILSLSFSYFLIIGIMCTYLPRIIWASISSMSARPVAQIIKALEYRFATCQKSAAAKHRLWITSVIGFNNIQHLPLQCKKIRSWHTDAWTCIPNPSLPR